MRIVYEHTADNVRRDCATWPADEQATWCELFQPRAFGRNAAWARRGRTPWSRSRQYTAANVYSRYLTVVRAAGLPDAVTPDGVRVFVAHQQEHCQPRTIHGQVAMLKAMAGLLHPDADWTWLDTTCRYLSTMAEQTPKRKNGARHLYSARDLYAVGVDLVVEGVQAGDSRWTTTQNVRDGLWLVLGVMCPERRRALAGLTLDEVDPDARTMTIPADRMKTGEASRRNIPDVVAETVRLWRDKYRAAHVPRNVEHGQFWIAKGGGPVSHTTMAAAMRTRTKARLGVAVSPHRLRDASATFIVEDLPEHAPLASVLLGHRGEAMTLAYTESAEQIDASRRLAAHLAAAHATTEQRVHGRRRPRR